MVGYHNCQTVPFTGNPNIYTPFIYFQDTKNYIIIFTTGGNSNPLSAPCTNNFGRFYIYSITTTIPITLTDELPSFQGVQAFINPNFPIDGVSLGLPAFNGYTKIVDIMTSDNLSKPNVIVMVYYEDV